MFAIRLRIVNVGAKFPCSNPGLFLDSKTFMTSQTNGHSHPKAPKTAPAQEKAGTEAPQNPRNETASAVNSSSSELARWQETRGLLQQALADWENSEHCAMEALKTAEAEKGELDALMKSIKAKLEALSK